MLPLTDEIVQAVELVESRLANGRPEATYYLTRMVEAGARGLGVNETAAWLGMDRHALNYQAQMHGLEHTPRFYVTLGKVLVCTIRHQTSRNRDEAVGELYHDGNRWSNTLYDRTGLRPSDDPTPGQVLEAYRSYDR